VCCERDEVERHKGLEGKFLETLAGLHNMYKELSFGLPFHERIETEKKVFVAINAEALDAFEPFWVFSEFGSEHMVFSVLCHALQTRATLPPCRRRLSSERLSTR
jgi:hypothetical protein